jgi:hypothetical protein
LPPGTYRIRVSLGQELENQVPEEGAKTIELVSWSEEPNSTILSYGDETNRYNWNTSGVVKWEKDFPRSGGEVTVTSTEARKWFGLKVRNWNKPNYWGGLHNYYLDGAFVTEQALAGYSAEWVARGF